MAAHQAPLSLGFSRQKYLSGLPFPSPMSACMLSHFSHVRLCAPPWTAAHQTPLSMEFFRQEYWSWLPFPTQGSSRPRDWTHVFWVSSIDRKICYHYATLKVEEVCPKVTLAEAVWFLLILVLGIYIWIPTCSFLETVQLFSERSQCRCWLMICQEWR